jgi:hypothetical protein
MLRACARAGCLANSFEEVEIRARGRDNSANPKKQLGEHATFKLRRKCIVIGKEQVILGDDWHPFV